MNSSLHVADWLFLGLYLLILLGLGFYKSNQTKKELDFILAGRKLSLPGFVVTLVATWYGGILGVGENTYNYGIQTWFIFALPYYVFGLLFAIFLASRIRSLPHVSIPDHFRNHYGPSAGIISAMFILFLASPAPYILSLGILLHFTIGWTLQFSILFSTFISLIYIWFGGFRSVVRTDILQFGLMFTGFLLLLYFAWSEHGSPVSIWASLPDSHRDPTGGNSFQYILVWFFIALWTFIDPGFYQRTAAANTQKIARTGIFISICFWFIFDLLTVTTGLYAASLAITNSAQMAYPVLASTLLPPFIYGIFLAGLLSTIMSTIDSNGLISAITFGRDILWRIQDHEQKDESVVYIRKGLVVMAFIAVMLALSIPSVVKLWYMIGSVIVPGILFPFLITFSKIIIPEKKIIQAMILPVLTAGAWFIYGRIEGYYPGGFEPFYPGLLVSLIFIIINTRNE